MGSSKNDLFTSEQNRIAELAKALGHPARIAILEYVIRKNACVCGDIVDELPLSQSTISQHLKALKMAGILQGNVEGAKICYCINPKVWTELNTLMSHFFKTYTNCC